MRPIKLWNGKTTFCEKSKEQQWCNGTWPWAVECSTFFKTFVKRLIIKLRTNSSVTKLFSLNNEATEKVLT